MGTLLPLPIPHASVLYGPQSAPPALTEGAARGASACRRQPGRRGRFVQKEEKGSISVRGGDILYGAGGLVHRPVCS